MLIILLFHKWTISSSYHVIWLHPIPVHTFSLKTERYNSGCWSYSSLTNGPPPLLTMWSFRCTVVAYTFLVSGEAKGHLVYQKYPWCNKWDKIRNETIRQALNVESILTIIERTQLRWYGHVLRMEDSRDTKRMYSWKPTQKRPPGRPRKRWEDQIKEITHRHEPDFQKVKALAIDRKGWRGLLKRLPNDRPWWSTGVRVRRWEDYNCRR